MRYKFQKSIFDIKSRASVPSVGITEESMEESPPGIGLCGWILTGLSLGLVLLTVPFSLFVCFKVQYSVRLYVLKRYCDVGQYLYAEPGPRRE